MLIGEIAALSTALFWAIGSMFFTFGIEKVGVIQMNIDRLFFASIYLFITLVLLGVDVKLTEKQLFFFVLSSIFGLVLGDTFLFKAYSVIGPRVSILIMSFSPTVAAVLAYVFLDESLSYWAILGITVTTAGIFLVIFEKDKDSNKFKLNNKKGILWAIGGMLGQSIGLIFAKLALKDAPIHPMVASLTRIFTGWLMMLPIGYFTKRFKFGFAPYRAYPKSFVAPIFGAVLGPYLGITLSLVAIEYVKVGIASTLMSTTPILILPISHFFYKEKLVWQSIAGAVIAVIGVAILFLR